MFELWQQTLIHTKMLQQIQDLRKGTIYIYRSLVRYEVRFSCHEAKHTLPIAFIRKS